MALTNLITDLLLGFAVFIAFVSCIGVLVMRNAYQRLQFCSVVVAFCPLLISVAVWINHTDITSRIKVVLVAAILLVMNSVLATATAKATRIRNMSHWEPHANEKILIVGSDEVAGEDGAVQEHQA
jgi:multisubunit Na+/H+ antiporter MnhG subunit